MHFDLNLDGEAYLKYKNYGDPEFLNLLSACAEGKKENAAII